MLGQPSGLGAAQPTPVERGKEGRLRRKRFKLRCNSKKGWAKLMRSLSHGDPSEESHLPVLVPLLRSVIGWLRHDCSREFQTIGQTTPHSGRSICKVHLHGYYIWSPLAASSLLHLLQCAASRRLEPDMVQRARHRHLAFEALYEFNHRNPGTKHLLL